MSYTNFFVLSDQELADQFVVKFNDGDFDTKLMTFTHLEGAWTMISKRACPGLSISETLIHGDRVDAPEVCDEARAVIWSSRGDAEEAHLSIDVADAQFNITLLMAACFIKELALIVRGWNIENGLGQGFVRQAAELVAEFEIQWPRLKESLRS